MKKSILILGLELVLLTAFGLDAEAQPKEVTESITTIYYATAKFVPLGADRGFMSYDAIGLTISDTGQGLFHQGTVRIVGSLTNEKGYPYFTTISKILAAMVAVFQLCFTPAGIK